MKVAVFHALRVFNGGAYPLFCLCGADHWLIFEQVQLECVGCGNRRNRALYTVGLCPEWTNLGPDVD